MRHWLRLLALCYAAGTVGGLAKGGVVLLLKSAAVTAPAGAALAGALPSGLYSRLVWAGIYGLLFALPLMRSSLLLRGLLWGLCVCALQLVVYPLWSHGALHLLAWSTLSVIVLNCVWGVVASASLRLTQ